MPRGQPAWLGRLRLSPEALGGGARAPPSERDESLAEPVEGPPEEDEGGVL